MKNIAKALVVLLAATCAASAYAKPILNETQGKEYRTLRDAVKRAESGDVIIVNESVTLTSPINPEERELTIKGASQDVVVTYDVTTSSGQHSAMITFDKDVIGGVVNIENLTFEGNSDVDLESNYILVRNGGTLNLKNVTFKGFSCSAKNGFMRALSDTKIRLSLVGSEMCIRDSRGPHQHQAHQALCPAPRRRQSHRQRLQRHRQIQLGRCRRPLPRS